LLLLGLSSADLFSHSVASVDELRTNGWEITQISSEDIVVSFALKLRNAKLLETTLWEVSLPSSPRYGKHLSESEVTEMVSPDESTIKIVQDFLAPFGLQGRLKSNNCYLEVSMTVPQAAKLFETELVQIHHIQTGGRVIQSLNGLNVPSNVASVLDMILGISTRVPTIRASRLQAKNSRLMAPSTGETTVPDLKKLYSLPSNLNVTNGKTTQGVGEFQEAWFSPDDAELFFFEKYSPIDVGRKVAHVIGTNFPQYATGEADLDVQYIMAMGSNTTTSFYYTNTGSFIDSLIQFFVNLNAEANPPLVISVSFGTNGNEPADVVNRLDVEVQKLGTRGVTVMFASGDNGVGCLAGKNEPDFPNSPYMLMVGATAPNPITADSEIGAALSSGGFSDDFPIAAFQTNQVATFYAKANEAGQLPPAVQYNASGRGFPDVSAIGVDLPIIVRGKEEKASGTSFSSPIVGGIISQLNDVRINAGKSPLGWINPLIYQISVDHPTAFQDITSGPKNGDSSCVGFEPIEGWDPVTGLGTLNYQVLSQVINLY